MCVQEELENLDGSSSELSRNKDDSSSTTGRFDNNTSTIDDKLAKVSLMHGIACRIANV
jgi:hypothetical protein